MKLSVVIPARNEADCLASTVEALAATLSREAIDYEILVVDDGSTDDTTQTLSQLKTKIPQLVPLTNNPPHGFGVAIRKGLSTFTGDAVAIYMADASDSPEDLVRFFRLLESNPSLDCVFGTRFARGAELVDYPIPKLILNRLANTFIQFLFGIRYNDVTNAFKLYRRHVIDGSFPLFSNHFNLTVELPLKAIVRGYAYTVLPNSWRNRKTGISKLKIKEMGSRYLFIVLYCFLEKWLSRGDYRKRCHGQVEFSPAGKDAQPLTISSAL